MRSGVINVPKFYNVLSVMKIPFRFLYWVILPTHCYLTLRKNMLMEDLLHKNNILATNFAVQEMLLNMRLVGLKLIFQPYEER